MQAKLPNFSQFNSHEFQKHLDDLLKENLKKIDSLLDNESFDWDNLMDPLEEMEDQLERFWSPFSHLHAVVNSTSLRECYQSCLPKLSAYESAIGHNKKLYEAIKSLEKSHLNAVQQKIVDDALLDFELAGVALSQDKKQRFEAIQTRLSKLSNEFENNILDSTQAFSLNSEDEKRIEGLPDHAINTASELAKEKNKKGYEFNLEFPCFQAVVTYAKDRSLRQEIYHAFVTRASDQGPSAGQYDNSQIMGEILALRHEKANLLGYANYADLSLASKMAHSIPEVLHFLFNLNEKAYPKAKLEFKKLKQFAKENLNISDLQPWDIAYASEKLKEESFDISQEDLRPYLPLKKVMEGIFIIINKLYGMSMREIKNVDTWHSDVRCYQVMDEKNEIRGFIYIDLFARANKRGGAWMDSLQSRRKMANGSIQLPIATLTCNFAKPSANREAILSHDEVVTLFHELGHCLHHVLTRVDYLSVSGIHGVEWDAVELPSQFFENWCWEKEALSLLTEHVDTKEPLPIELFDRLIAAKNFHSAMGMVRQLEFSIFDLRIHHEFNQQEVEFVTKVLNEVRQQTAVVPIAPFNRFEHSFSHIFAGGYAAGYYSYKWAEVLSSDAFSRFEEEGIFNEKTGRDFLHNILEIGGAQKAHQAFENFRGRPARVDALLRHNDI